MTNRRQIIAGIAASVAVPTLASAQAKIVFKATDVHPLGYPTVEAVERLGKKLEAATNGRLSVQMYPSMQLGGEKEMIEQAQLGALQFARISVCPSYSATPSTWRRSSTARSARRCSRSSPSIRPPT
jgi:TRAP-type C4-dicarboxylate transport system substrate-binding protein